MMQDVTLPGIVLFAFNRPQLLAKTVSALAANTLATTSRLTIYCDGPRNENDIAQVEATRDIARRVSGFASVSVVERKTNMGCANSIISGITQSFELTDRLAVFEDDILAAPYTLSYLATCLDKYEQSRSIFSISAWSPPPTLLHIPASYPFGAYFVPRCNVWGWGIWRDRWQSVDWSVVDYDFFKKNKMLRDAFNQGGPDLSAMLALQMEGVLDAWDIRMDYARFKQGCVGLNPVRSYTTNIGMGSGTHTTAATTRFDNDLSLALPKPQLPDHIFVNPAVAQAYRKVYAPPALPVRAVNKTCRILFGKNVIDV